MAVGVAVRPLEDADHEWKVDTLVAGWGSTDVARLGELVDAAGLPGFAAVRDDGERIGLLTYAIRPDGCEVVTLQALVEGVGVGRVNPLRHADPGRSAPGLARRTRLAR